MSISSVVDVEGIVLAVVDVIIRVAFALSRRFLMMVVMMNGAFVWWRRGGVHKRHVGQMDLITDVSVVVRMTHRRRAGCCRRQIETAVVAEEMIIVAAAVTTAIVSTSRIVPVGRCWRRDVMRPAIRRRRRQMSQVGRRRYASTVVHCINSPCDKKNVFFQISAFPNQKSYRFSYSVK